jgi:hypothetical protein
MPEGAPAQCQSAVAKAASGLAQSWTRALTSCEVDNVSGANNPPEDCSTDPDGDIQAAIAKSDASIARCTDFTGLPGCAASGNVADTQTCVAAAVQSVAPGFTGVAYP